MEPYSVSFLRYLAVLLTTCIALSGSSAPSCSSLDAQFIYDYESEVLVGIEDVVPVTSLYKLKGQLVVQRNLNSEQPDPVECSRFQLKDVKYHTYHGNLETKESQEEHYENAPPESSDLSVPFDVFYVNGTFEKMNHANHEQNWSLNMKKSLANAFQLPPISLIGRDKAFENVETSMYGFCKPDYSSVATDSGLYITKVYFSNLCRESYVHSLDVEQSLPRKGANFFQDFNGMKKYKVNTKDYSHPIIESIEASEKMHNSQFTNSGEKKLVLIRQNITLKHVEKDLQLANEVLIEDGKYHTVHDLQYRQAPSGNPFGLLYVTNGRSSFQGNHLEVVMKKFDEVVDYLKTNHLSVNSKEIKQHQIINELLMNLRYLNAEEIQTVYTAVISSGSSSKDVTRKNLFFQMLPLIGTQASVDFVLYLLKTGEIKDEKVIQNVLTDIPFYILNYNKELIADAQVLLNLNPDLITSETRNVAILSFSIMFGKFCGELSTNTLKCDPESVSLIAEHFFKEVNENEDNTLKQLVYIEGLKNLQVLEAVNHLEKIITKKNIIVDDDLRLRAMMGPHPITKFPSKVHKIYMPILTNTSEPLEMRAVALQMILESQLENPEYKPFTLHWHMASETSHQLYNYYYTNLQSYANSVNPQHHNKKSAAAKILHISRKPSVQSWETTASMYNYVSEPYGYGYEFVFRAFGDGKKAIPSMLYAELNSISSGGPVNEAGFYFRIKGLQDALIQHILSGIRGPKLFTTLERFMAADQIVTEPLYIEFIVQRQGYTVGLEFVGRNTHGLATPDEIMKQLMNLNEQIIFYDTLTDRTYMTDMGVPVVLNMHYPVVMSVAGNFDFDRSLKVQMDVRMSYSGGSNLLVFNPVANTWHGVSRGHSTEFQLPINAEIILDKKEKLFEFTLQKSDDGDGHIGVQGAARTYSGVFSGDSAVPTNLQVIENDYSPAFETKEIGYSSFTVDSDLGYNFNVAAEGCSCPGTGDFVSSNKDETDTLSEMWTRFDLFTRYLSYQPVPGNCSMSIFAAPQKQNDGSKFSIKMKINGVETSKVPLSGYKFNVQTKIQLSGGKSTNKAKTISVNTDVSTSDNGINTSIKSKISSEVDGVISGDPFVINYEKNFPPLGSDAFKYGWGDETVKTTISFEKCNSEESSQCQSVQLSVKGEISDEQKRIASSDVYPYNQCREDKNKPEWQGPLYPRTWACYESALRLFYTRKVSLEMSSKNMPYGLADHVGKKFVMNYRKYLYDLSVASDHFMAFYGHLFNQALMNGNNDKLNMTVIYSAKEPTADVALHIPTGSFTFKDVPGIDRDIFSIQLDNTHFSKFLQFIQSTSLIRSCVASSASVLTPDNTTVNHQFGSQYEALSKLQKSGKFGVYAKKSSNGMVAKVVVGDAVLEISGNSATLNGKTIQNLEQGFQYPSDNPWYYLRIWSNQGQITVNSRRLGVYVIYSPVSVTVDQTILLKGFVDGLCGDLGVNGDSNSEYNLKNEELNWITGNGF